MTNKINIVIGTLYELPDGRVVRTYRSNGITGEIGYYFDDDTGSHTIKEKECGGWKERRDIRDFPNARDPRLPYVFDLLWDIKYMSQLKQELDGHDDEEDIREEMLKNNISI